MTKAISSYPEAQRPAVIQRRLKQGGGGSGYWAAVQAAQKLGLGGPIKKMSRSQRDRQQKADGREFAKKFVERKKVVRRRPAHENKMRMA